MWLRRAALPVRVEGGKGLRGERGWDGLHTVELVPTFAPGQFLYTYIPIYMYIMNVHVHTLYVGGLSVSVSLSCIESCMTKIYNG